jgi:hypothetical protein
MAQHEPVARIEALYRNEWPRSAIFRLMQRTKESLDAAARPKRTDGVGHIEGCCLDAAPEREFVTPQ